MLFFTFIKGGGGTPLTRPPNPNGFSSIIRGGGKSLLTNVNKKMFFLMKASLSKQKENSTELHIVKPTGLKCLLKFSMNILRGRLLHSLQFFQLFSLQLLGRKMNVLAWCRPGSR